MTNHKSDCAVHNEPAMKAGPCDCGAGIVEAMARAMLWTKLTDLGRVECKWPDDFGDDECAAYRGMARAALTAALDCMYNHPSYEMAEAAYTAWDKTDGIMGPQEVLDLWQAMLEEFRREALDG